MKRRKFIKAVSIGSMVAMGSGYGRTSPAQAGESGRSGAMTDEPVIEWNAHVWSPDLQRYPFHPNATYRPDVSERSTCGEYLQRLDDRGIDRAVIVQPEPYGDDHSLVLDCLEREPGRTKGTSLFYPRDPEAPRKLAELVRREPRIVATRFHAHRNKQEYLDTFADPGVRALWEQAVDLDIVIELHVGPDYALQVAEAIEAFPGCKVLLDHLAKPDLGTAVEYANVLDLARFPNVYMKLSGLNYIAEDAPLYESARPFTRRVIGEFGPDRVVWGSGTPHIVDAHMEEYSEADRAKVKGGNIRRLLNW